MGQIKQFLKTKQAKIGLAVLCVVAVLTVAFLLQPSPTSGVPVADNSTASSSGNSVSDSEIESSVSSSASSLPDASATTSKPTFSTGSGMDIDLDTGKDEYQTDPVPEGQPTPVEPEDAVIDESKKLTCTLSIRCDTILNNMNLLKEEKKALVPQNGVILETTTVTFSEGESVFDVLKRVTRERRIHMEFEMTPIYNSAYIEGIHNLYEFDCGNLSGWMYKVNDWFPNYGCSRYQLKQGDVIEWVYTCDLGKDVGGDYAAGQESER